MKDVKFAKGLSLPPDCATQTFGFIAKKRAGKSYAAGVLLEGLNELGVPFAVLDPVGRHYGLRLAADGKKKGIDVVILGGLRGDIPLDPTAGKLVADAFCDTGRSFILDVSQFSLGERKRFATAFGEQLWLRQKALKDPRPMHVVLEEAQLFLPQAIQSDDARMVGVWVEIVRLGGNVGIGVSLITQRPQSVSKEALTQVECLVVLQVNGVPEKKALKEWMVEKGGELDLLDELPFLETGVAYIWSPTWLNHFGKHKILSKWTYDASSTPKVGVKRVQADLPKLDLSTLREQMAESVKKGEENDPTALKRQVAELKKQLAKPQVCAVPERKEVSAISAQELKRLEVMFEKGKNIADRLEASAKALVVEMGNLASKVMKRGTLEVVSKTNSGERLVTTHEVLLPTDNWATRILRTESVAGGARKMLIALATRSHLTKTQIATLSGFSPNSGTTSTYMSQLNVAGYMVKSGNVYGITKLGLDLLGSDAKKGYSPQEILDLWKTKFPGKVASLLQHLADTQHQMTKEEMAAHMEMSSNSGTCSTYLSMLRSNELVITEAGLTRISPAFQL